MHYKRITQLEDKISLWKKNTKKLVKLLDYNLSYYSQYIE